MFKFLLTAICHFLADQRGVVTVKDSFGNEKAVLTAPQESFIGNYGPDRLYYDPVNQSYSGPGLDQYRHYQDLNRMNEENRTNQLAQQTKAGANSLNRQQIINALLGGGKAQVDRGYGGGIGQLDPTAQFGKLLGMLQGANGNGNASASGSTGDPTADYDKLYSQLNTLMASRGGSYENDINQSAAEASKTAAARMMARGLGGSTLVDASNARINRDKTAALNKLHDTLLGQDIGTLSTVGIEGLKAKQNQAQFNAQMQLANQGNGMRLLQTLLGLA